MSQLFDLFFLPAELIEHVAALAADCLAVYFKIRALCKAFRPYLARVDVDDLKLDVVCMRNGDDLDFFKHSAYITNIYSLSRSSLAEDVRPLAHVSAAKMRVFWSIQFCLRESVWSAGKIREDIYLEREENAGRPKMHLSIFWDSINEKGYISIYDDQGFVRKKYNVDEVKRRIRIFAMIYMYGKSPGREWKLGELVVGEELDKYAKMWGDFAAGYLNIEARWRPFFNKDEYMRANFWSRKDTEKIIERMNSVIPPAINWGLHGKYIAGDEVKPETIKEMIAKISAHFGIEFIE